ncbi:nucleotidyltransferase domain-containing protein [Lysinibacillus sp. NPDC097195]|uniref:nucleotidyltransferase domain-containing protein n=1 Tax=Lysinibacillus sp. NPDC097195 TaxID=3364141 RepID=UPI00382092FD
MILEEIVAVLVASFKNNPLVKAIFLKGSIARNEHDHFADIDLYCLIDKDDMEKFLPQRIAHLKDYKNPLFSDDIFIVAPYVKYKG